MEPASSHSARVEKLRWSEDTSMRRATSIMPASSALARWWSAPGGASRRGPGAGENGTAASSFG